MVRRQVRVADDSDVLVTWAAEEFVSAGRVEDAASRAEHRRRAAFFSDVFRGLRTTPVSAPEPNAPDLAIVQILARAFGQPGHAAHRPSNGAAREARDPLIGR